VQHLSDPLVASAALEESLAKARGIGDGITVVGSLNHLAGADCALGRFRDALDCAEEALATAKRLDYAWGVGSSLGRVQQAALALGELARAGAAGTALLELGESLDHQFFIQAGHWSRGWVGIYRSEPSAAQELSAARELAEGTHDYVSLGDICTWQGALALALGQDEDGRQVLERAIPVVDAFVPTSGARARCLLAELAVRKGDLTEAQRWLEGTLTLPKADQLLATRAQARLARAKGDARLAWELADEGLQLGLRSGTQLVVVDFLELLALVAAGTERFVEAGRLLSAATTERKRLGYARFAVDQPDVDLALGSVEAALGTSGLAAAWSEGTGLSVDDAVAYARRGRGERGRPSSGWVGLTPTERKVVELVIEGLTNAEIGARMFVSTGTVKSHLNHIYNKLGATSRRQLVDAARQVIV
jgi:DNA-binding CsgD family transcriptional regulator